MARLTDYTSYADAHRHFSSAALWELFDGDRQAFNLAHECVDRHVAPGRVDVRVADDPLMAELAPYPPHYEVRSRADDLAVFQYTSGTTRELPAAVRHTQRAVVVLMVAALYGTGIRPGDRYFCPSSPAWGHGLWHGTLAPLAMGVTTGTMAGKFEAVRLLRALQDYEVTNLSAAATHYRMMKSSGEM